MNRRASNSIHQESRNGFTMIELLGVVSIIVVLAALLTMAANGAYQSAKMASARVEISQLEAALAAFKLEFGVKPPSRIILCENGADWPSESQSMALMRQMWPQMDFNLHHDINRNGMMSEKISLDAAECLVFFLGGTVDDGVSLNGFSKNRSDPFRRETAVGSRIGPFYQFSLHRLIDDDGDGIYAYQDGFKAGDPIVYYTNYEGYSFDPADLCWGMTEFYRPAPPPSALPNAATNPYQYDGTQIIAAGPDGELGVGGIFSPDKPIGERFGGVGETLARQNEADNLTNFHSGALGK